MLKRALAIHDVQLGQFHWILALNLIATSLRNLASVLTDAGKLAEARTTLEVGPSHPRGPARSRP
jgi:hypothetical protein